MMQRVGGGDSSVKTETREMNILCVIFACLFICSELSRERCDTFWVLVLVISNINSISHKSLNAPISTQYKWAY